MFYVTHVEKVLIYLLTPCNKPPPSTLNCVILKKKETISSEVLPVCASLLPLRLLRSIMKLGFQLPWSSLYRKNPIVGWCCTLVHYTSLYYAVLHYIALHREVLHYIALHRTVHALLNGIALYFTALQSTVPHCTAVHCT